VLNHVLARLGMSFAAILAQFRRHGTTLPRAWNYVKRRNSFLLAPACLGWSSEWCQRTAGRGGALEETLVTGLAIDTESYAATSVKSSPSWVTLKDSSITSVSRRCVVLPTSGKSVHSTIALPRRSKPQTHPGSPAMQFAKKTLDPKRIGKLLSMLTIVHGFLKKSNELLAKMAAAYTSCRLLRVLSGARQ
jgi:hypothetical protein